MSNTTEDTISSHTATTHSLFAKDVVLPALGENPEGWRRLTEELTAEMAPRNLVERHYVEKIAAALWRLRRLHRWQAGLFGDATLTENERLDRLEKALRHETALNRQVDTAIKMLNKNVPQLYGSRARTNCQNEPAARAAADPSEGRPFSERDSSPRSSDVSVGECQNEPASSPSRTTPPPHVSRTAVRSNGVGSNSAAGASLSLTAAGRLIPARTDAARRLLFSA